MVHYRMNVMEAQRDRYEKDKQDLLYALSNLQMTPQFLAAYNQKEQQKSQASWASHNQRMQVQQQQFNSWQKTQKTLSEVSDINHAGWQARNQIQDRMQDYTVDGIREVESDGKSLLRPTGKTGIRIQVLLHE